MTRIHLFLGASALALTAGAAAAEDPELTIFTWSGYESEPYWAGYAEEFGESPTYTFFGEEEEAFQKLRSGFQADVGHPCPQSVIKWREAGLIEPWDISKIPNYQTIAEVYRTNPEFVIDGEVYFIPGDNGATAIAYNTEEVPAEDVASLDVFLNPKYAGRISIADNVDDAYALAFLATGVTDWTQATQEDLDAASAWLREAHQNVRTYWNDGASLAQLMGTGEVLIAWAWNETPTTMSAEGFPIAFQRETVEGSSIWTCGYVNLVDGPGSEDKAHFWMNQWLEPEVTEYIVTDWGYGHSNTEAMAAMDPALIEAAGLGPVDVPLLAQVPTEISLREQMIEEFERIKAGF